MIFLSLGGLLTDWLLIFVSTSAYIVSYQTQNSGKIVDVMILICLCCGLRKYFFPPKSPEEFPEFTRLLMVGDLYLMLGVLLSLVKLFFF